MTAADRKRVSALTLGRRASVQRGVDAIEELAYGGRVFAGMAREGDRCVAQGDDGLCDIHAEHGLHTKPVPCQQFPLRLQRSPRGVHVSLLLACEGYDRARPAAEPWPSREPEVRHLLAMGASAIPMALPVELSVGLPVETDEWWSLRAALYAAEPSDDVAQPDSARRWLAAAIRVYEDHAARAHAALREHPAMSPRLATEGLDAVLGGHRGVFAGLDEPLAAWLGALGQRLDALAARGETAEHRRLTRLGEAVKARRSLDTAQAPAPLPIDPDAARHLVDIVANDLQLQIALGHVDAGLRTLAVRLLLAEALADRRARAAGLAEVTARQTTEALEAVYRSEPDVQQLAGIRAHGGG
jgi:hypothetical protein